MISSGINCFAVYDTKQDVYFGTFDISNKHYFGVLREPVNNNSYIKPQTSSKILECMSEYLKRINFINKYNLLKSMFKNETVFKIFKACFTVDKELLTKVCKETQYKNDCIKELFKQQEKEYEINVKKYIDNANKANHLYTWLNSINYIKV